VRCGVIYCRVRLNARDADEQGTEDCGVGSANVDLTTFSDRFPPAGGDDFRAKVDLGFGGEGREPGRAARLCGADVVMVAKLGNDLFGEATVKNFGVAGH